MKNPFCFTLCSFITLCLIISGCVKKDEIILPLPPSSLTATPLSKSQISLAWKDNSANEDGFKIDRKTASTNFTLVATLDADKVLYVDTALQANTEYSYRVYAYNVAGNSETYSNTPSARTANEKVAATVLTSKVDSISTEKALSGGTIASDGDSPILEKGVVWDKAQNPTIDLATRTAEGSGPAEFKSYLKNLIPNTTYYVRAYATNAAGTAYGNQEVFTTKSLALPILSDSAIFINPDTSFATVYVPGIRSVGGAPLLSRGVVWSTNPNPTIDLPTKTDEGNKPGSYQTRADNLISKTKYFIRDYATNAAGVIYGRETSFKTIADVRNVEIGDSFRGGIVFYLLQPADIGYSETRKHGLISSMDISLLGFNWSSNNSTVFVGGTDSAIGSGEANTAKIVSAFGDGLYAAKHCVTFYSEGYGWYLPSKLELNLMYQNIGKGAPAPLTNIGNFQNLTYWSSTEVNNLYAYFQYFGDGSTGFATSKSNAYLVRAIKSF